MARIPNNQHITYQFQFRKCGKPSCSTCKSGQGHGPYWYAYWREGSRLKSGYIGKKKIIAGAEGSGTGGAGGAGGTGGVGNKAPRGRVGAPVAASAT